ncbi:MAG: hypothetical protein HQM16_06910 [Deltaproteobacteria bacterium]|nr:hypothetical protein [Deltaproteobacteria bacterium]
MIPISRYQVKKALMAATALTGTTLRHLQEASHQFQNNSLPHVPVCLIKRERSSR